MRVACGFYFFCSTPAHAIGIPIEGPTRPAARDLNFREIGPDEFIWLGELKSDDTVCSGTLVSPRLVLSAWHCVSSLKEIYNFRLAVSGLPGGTSVPAKILAFHPNALTTAKIEGLDFERATDEIDRANDIRHAVDWALMILETPITGFASWPILNREIPRSLPDLTAAGFGFWYRGWPIATKLCSNFKYDPNKAAWMGHCPAIKGMSGGPLYSPQSRIVFGITSHLEPGPGPDAYFATHELPQAIFDLISADQKEGLVSTIYNVMSDPFSRKLLYRDVVEGMEGQK